MASDPEKKLDMSLDAIIRTRSAEKGSGGTGRPRGGAQPNRNPRHQNQPQHQRGRGQHGPPGHQGQPQFPRQQQMGRGQGHNNGWRPQGGPPGQMFPPGGPIMPNFGFPFGEGPFAGFPNPMMQQMMQGMGFPPPGMLPMGPTFANGPDFGGPRIRPPQAQRDQQIPPSEAAVPIARLDDASGEVTVSLKHQTIVKVAQSGAITLDSGGIRGAIMFQALNAVLNVVGVTVTRPAKNDEWSISDGHSLSRFRDGMVIPGKGPQSAQRGPKIVAAFGGGDPTAAAAATAASNAAAAAAGIVLGKKPAEATQRKAAPARAEQHRGNQPDSHQTHGQWSRDSQNGTGRQNGAVGSGQGEDGSWDADKIRRQKAKGRYRPY